MNLVRASAVHALDTYIKLKALLDGTLIVEACIQKNTTVEISGT